MSYVPTDPKLRAIAERLPAENWAARVAAADREAGLLGAVLKRVQGGQSRREVLAELAPQLRYQSTVRRLRRFAQGGRDALIDRRAPRCYRQKVTTEVRTAVRVLACARPDLYAYQLASELEASIGVALGESTVRELLRQMGLSRQRGRPKGSGGASTEEVETTRLALAGAELVKGLEEHVGAVQALTAAIDVHLRTLPSPAGAVRDDGEHRDERGRFQPSYNLPGDRTDAELGARFGAVEQVREGKDLREMQVVARSRASRYRKDLALTLLPVVVDSPRWSSLRFWSGQHLDELVGHAYQPATLDKYTRELKYAGASHAARDAVATFWFEQEGAVVDKPTGAVVLYADGATKPLWTRHFSRSTKVSKTGRVQPATTTLVLNSGAGTPLVYQEYSGGVSLPSQVPLLLSRWERAAGEGTARRLLVVDRECHATWLLKELDRGGWLFVVPVRQSSTGRNARWEDVGPWAPLHDGQPAGAQHRDATLWLNDSLAPKEPLKVRAITRRRNADDGGATWATNAPIEQFDGRDILRLYGKRWSNQEHVFRDANGRVGLDMHHGYGKHKVLNVAVIDRLERLDGSLTRLGRQLAKVEAEVAELEEAALHQAEANKRITAWRAELLAELGRTMIPGTQLTATSRRPYERLQAVERALPQMREAQAGHLDGIRSRTERMAKLHNRITKLSSERDRLKEHTEIYTVDVELDEIMTAYKLTFLNLSRLLMRDYLKVDWQVDTLIRSVLTLPGERRRTASTETIRIDYQSRDPAAMEAVQRACERLNACDLYRGERAERRRLRFELAPPKRGRPASGSD